MVRKLAPGDPHAQQGLAVWGFPQMLDQSQLEGYVWCRRRAEEFAVVRTR
jgi:hypothetical protein